MGLGRVVVRRPIAAPVALVGVIAAAPFMLGSSQLPVLVPAGIYALAAVGLGPLIGRAGQVSLGQFALVGTGAYGAAWASTTVGVTPALALVVAIALGLGLALLTITLLRLSGLYLSLATLAFALLFERLAVVATGLTGGADGIAVSGTLGIAGIEFATEESLYWLVWLSVVGAVLVASNALGGRFGRALDAVRTDEAVAAAAGIAVARAKAITWLYSGACAGLAGGYLAYYNQFVTPEQFSLEPSIVLVAAVVVGGAGTAVGPVAGVVLIQVLPDLLHVNANVDALLVPVLLVVVSGFLPGGLVDLRRLTWRRSRHVTAAEAQS
jgi:ABC-type branched-subunit amino acid transport system permease subunit